MRTPALVFCLLLLSVAPSRAQSLADFEPDLLRLSEILGGVSYLDTLCGAAEAGQWRVKMAGLLAAQNMTPENRRRYVDAYNRGHRTLAAIHRTCNDRVRGLIENYLEEGATISDRLVNRNGASTAPLATGPVMDLGNTPAH